MDPRQAEVALSLAQARELFERQELLPLQDAVAIVDEAQRVMGAEPNIVPVSAANVYGKLSRSPQVCNDTQLSNRPPLTVIGDIHGQFFDLTRLLDDIGVGPRELKGWNYHPRIWFNCRYSLIVLGKLG